MKRNRLRPAEEEPHFGEKGTKRLGLTLFELMSRSLQAMLSANSSKPWMRYAGMIASGDPNSSRKIDEIVYGGDTP